MKTLTHSPLWIVGLAMSLIGCGTFQVPVTHSPLPPAPITPKGIVLFQSFSDARSVPDQRHLGEARNTSGLYCGPIADSQNRAIADILTDQFAAALRAAGYQTILPAAAPSYPDPRTRADTVLEGQVRECWLTTHVGAVSDNTVKIAVQVQLRQLQTGELLYQKCIVWEENYRTSWKSALKQALDAVLTKAVHDFSSPEFSQVVVREVRKTAAR